MGLTMLAVLSMSMVLSACGHSVLFKPRARNWVAHLECQGSKTNGYECPTAVEEFSCKTDKFNKGCKENDPQSLNAWGVQPKAKALKKWPSPIGTFGLCGDPVQLRGWVPMEEMPYMVPTTPQAVYTAGEIVEFEVGVYAEHHGHYEFRICDKGLDGRKLKDLQDGEDCLKKWVLKRAPPSGDGPDSQPIDKRHPGRWHVGASGSKVNTNFVNASTVVAGRDWDDRDIVGVQAELPSTIYKMRYIIPEDLECERCTLQHYWPTANTCVLDDDVAKYWEDLGREPPTYWPGKNACKAGVIHGEEFWNCADITVKPKVSFQPRRRRRSPSLRRRRGSRRRTRRRRRRSSDRRRGRRRR